jgi:hypothetical protein
VDLVVKPVVEVARRPPRLGGYSFPGSTSKGRAALGGLVRAVATAPAGQRNEVLNWAAYQAADHVIDGELVVEDAVAALTDAGLAAGLTEIEVTRTVRSGLKRVWS